jgi:glycosyltransferase involved in cell wall biosynthesis
LIGTGRAQAYAHSVLRGPVRSVTLYTRPNTQAIPGGDLVLEEWFAHFWQAAGVEIVRARSDDELAGAETDLCHVFNLTSSHPLDQPLLRLRSRRPTVGILLSPVYWSYGTANFYAALTESWLKGRPDAPVSELLDALAQRGLRLVIEGETVADPEEPRWRRTTVAPHDAYCRRVVALSDAICASCPGELGELSRAVGPLLGPTVTIPYPLNQPVATSEADSPAGDYVLCLGRLEPRKNQLGLIRAVASLGLPLVVAGAVVAGQETYAAACRRLASETGAEVSFRPPVAGNDLVQLYRGARVVAQPSYLEYPGLGALEGLAMGKATVCGLGGAPPDVFGDHVEYCDAGQWTTLVAALAAAWRHGPRRPDSSAWVRRAHADPAAQLEPEFRRLGLLR